MKKNLFHIVLSLLLTVAVTDYVWYDLLQDDKWAIELEADAKEKTDGEELVEDNLKESKDYFFFINWPPAHYQYNQHHNSDGLIKIGNGYTAISHFYGPKPLILYCQLRIDC